jgi:hypothetical protein
MQSLVPGVVDGQPQRLVDPVTGQIDTTVFSHWKQFDISLYLRTHWDHTKKDLDGKVRVSVGNLDNFLLNYAVKLLHGEMKKIHADVQFAYYPGDHFTVGTPEYVRDGEAFLKHRYLLWLKDHPDSQ